MGIANGIDQFLRALRPSGRVSARGGSAVAVTTDVADATDATETPLAPAVVADAESPPSRAASPEPYSDRMQRLEAATGLVETLGLGFHLGTAVERIATASGEGRYGAASLREASWLIERYAELVEQRPVGADLHAANVRLSRTGEALAELRALAESLSVPEAAPVSAPSAPSAPSDPVEVVEPREPIPDVAPPPPSLAHELTLMTARWVVMVVSVIAIVLAVTLIAEWR